MASIVARHFRAEGTRYFRAEGKGAISRQTVTEVIAGLTVIASKKVVPAPTNATAETDGRAIDYAELAHPLVGST